MLRSVSVASTRSPCSHRAASRPWCSDDVDRRARAASARNRSQGLLMGLPAGASASASNGPAIIVSTTGERRRQIAIVIEVEATGVRARLGLRRARSTRWSALAFDAPWWCATNYSLALSGGRPRSHASARTTRPRLRERASAFRSRLDAAEARLARVEGEGWDRVGPTTRAAALQRRLGARFRASSRARRWPRRAVGVALAAPPVRAAARPTKAPLVSGARRAIDLVLMVDWGRELNEEVSLQQIRGYLDDRTSLIDAAPSEWPVRDVQLLRYGWRTMTPTPGPPTHAGIDIAAPRVPPSSLQPTVTSSRAFSHSAGG